MIFRSFKISRYVLALLACLWASAFEAFAGDIPLYAPVQEQDPNKSFVKPPVKFGSFLLFSDITVGETYNDNILAQETGAESDFITTIAPTAQLVKSFGRHNFAVTAGAQGARFVEHQDENTLDYSGAFLGDIEVYHTFHIPLKLAYSLGHQGRTNRRLTSLTKNPVELTHKTAQSGFVYQPNRLKLEFLGTYDQARVADSTLLVSGARVNARDRAKNTLELATTLSYETQTSWKPIVKLIYNTEDYLRRTLTATGFDGINRSNTTLRALAGIGFDYKGLLSGIILLGPEKHEYAEPAADPVKGFSADVVIKFSPSARTDGQFNFGKRSYDDNLLLSGLTETTYGLALSHELNARWSVNGKGSYSHTEFLSSTRQDDEYAGSGSVVYNIQRGLALEGSYGYQTRESTAPSLSYDQSVVMLGLKNTF